LFPLFRFLHYFPDKTQAMIIYTFPIRTAFIDRDLEMITPTLKIKPLEFTQSPSKLLYYFLLQFFQLLWYLPRTSQYLCFFGGYHSVLPVCFGRIFGKPCTIQAGGMDCMNMPEIGYGNFRKKWLRMATVYSFKNCSLILPVAEALIKQDYLYDSSISSKQGLHNLISNLKTPIKVIPNGFDTSFWENSTKERTPFSFISVATGTSHPARAIVKGYDLIERLAVMNPNWSFTLIGDSNYSSDHPNIKILGKLTPAELKTQYHSHLFYLQLSTSEGFPNALGEAMACGCFPIGSAVGAIPEIIGDTRCILKTKSMEELKSLFSPENLKEISAIKDWPRNRIKSNFTFEKRKIELLQTLRTHSLG
jgi:glycosyltransferase involved in cell wall biosynthesis